MKKFCDLIPGEKLFILQPFTMLIHQAEVKTSQVHPQSKNKKVWVLEFYIPFKNQKITEDALKIAETHFSKTATQVFLNKDEHMSLILIKPAPTLISTSKEAIEKWLKTMTPSDLAGYLQLQSMRRK